MENGELKMESGKWKVEDGYFDSVNHVVLQNRIHAGETQLYL